ncbi:MAG: hypothetical protein LPK07_01940 [Hymenobacteraceae bacterium]|nr:hypothetical protein [Hymenobacteraceae bacterium]MDX5480423.1 hypothetical protein [Hymenobacteraceae bacterium]
MRKFNPFRSLFVAASLAISAFTFTGCSNDDNGPSGAYAEDGVFVVVEGNFGTPNGSISYYNKNTQEAQHNIFGKENEDRPLGDVIQNMVLQNDHAYIVANNSNKIEIVNAYTFKSEGVVEGLSSPRYFAALNSDKGYVTEWLPYNADYSYNNGRVSVLDLKTRTVIKTIEVGVQPEQLLVAGGKVYVINQGSSSVSVINSATDAVERTIPVTAGPNSIALDKNNMIWVLSAGNKSWRLPASEHTAGALTKINPSSDAIVSTFPFPKATASASKLVLNGAKDKLYYQYDGKVYQQSATSASLAHTLLIERSFYGLGVDPSTGNIYGGEQIGFTGDGTVYIYRPDGTELNTFTVGTGPNGFVFN